MLTACQIIVECPAKINLTFEILGMLTDGYHEVRTLLATVSLADELSFKITPLELTQAAEGDQAQISLTLHPEQGTTATRENFPMGSDNLAAKAIQLYLKANPLSRKLQIKVQVKKRIPIQAGLAGGSANAAAALAAMNSYAQAPMSEEALLELAAKLGADVPFCLSGGLKLGTFRGDKLEALPTPENTIMPAVILAKPRHLAISTPWAFGQYDEARDKISLAQRCQEREITNNPTLFAGKQFLKNEWHKAIPALGNDFEQVILPAHRELVELRQKLKRLGALSCNLTGSGPTMYALCRNLEEAQAILEAYKQEDERDCPACVNKYDPVDLYAAQIVNYGARVL
jgi:4-diphosphocytidyl-2-C-methyl-D-erythritol kinase